MSLSRCPCPSTTGSTSSPSSAIASATVSHGISPVARIRSRCQVCHRVLACPSSTLVALARIAGNGVRTIVVQTANHFARDLMVQEVGFAMLRDLGVTLIAADNPSSFLDDGPTSRLIRQILGAVSEFDKAMTVAKLKGARDRVRRQRGKCEGRKSYAEREGGAELVAIARQLHTNPNGRSPSLRTIAATLAARGFVTPSGRHYSASAVASMLAE
jgi:Resolvase, N terminal domain